MTVARYTDTSAGVVYKGERKLSGTDAHHTISLPGGACRTYVVANGLNTKAEGDALAAKWVARQTA